MPLKIIDLATRKPTKCIYCRRTDMITPKMYDWLCLACMKNWPKLSRGQLYLKVIEPDIEAGDE